MTEEPGVLSSTDRGETAKGAILKPVLAYAAFASLWILFSDQVVAWLFRDPDQISIASTLKGWLFVAVTSGLLFILLRSWRESLTVGTSAQDWEIPAAKTKRLRLLFVALALIVPLLGVAFVR